MVADAAEHGEPAEFRLVLDVETALLQTLVQVLEYCRGDRDVLGVVRRQDVERVGGEAGEAGEIVEIEPLIVQPCEHRVLQWPHVELGLELVVGRERVEVLVGRGVAWGDDGGRQPAEGWGRRPSS